MVRLSINSTHLWLCNCGINIMVGNEFLSLNEVGFAHSLWLKQCFITVSLTCFFRSIANLQNVKLEKGNATTLQVISDMPKFEQKSFVNIFMFDKFILPAISITDFLHFQKGLSKTHSKITEICDYILHEKLGMVHCLNKGESAISGTA